MDIKNAWLKIMEKYSIIKELYIECEETDPELKTNLQPLNEFRAALDHIMKLTAAHYYDEDEIECNKQFDKLMSHLNRAFYDICDMLSVNYRNKILDILSLYSIETIKTVFPDYYSETKHTIEEISQNIVKYRNQKGNNGVDDYNRFDEYKSDVFKLKEIFLNINSKQNVLEDVENEHRKTERRSNLKNYIIGGIIGFIGSAIVSLIFYLIQIYNTK